MKYYNKEYGFQFRPPYQKKFNEILDVAPNQLKPKFPSAYKQGVGYDYSAINGAMLIGKNGTLWGIRVSCFNGKKWLENSDFMSKLSPSCIQSKTGNLSRFASGDLSLEWVKNNEQSLFLRIGFLNKKELKTDKMRIRVIFYPCHNWPGEISVKNNIVEGKSPFVGILMGDIKLTDSFAEFHNRYRVVFDDIQDREYFFAYSYTQPLNSAQGAFNEGIMEFVLNKQQPTIDIYAAVGTDEYCKKENTPSQDVVKKKFDFNQLNEVVENPRGDGLLGISTSRLYNNLHWSKIYYPYLLTEIFSPNRNGLDNHFNIDGLQENCSALLGCFVQGSSNALKQIKYTIEDKLFSVISVWYIFCNLKDKKEAYDLYKSLLSLYPPIAELVIAGEDKNEVAYKWSDSVLKEKNDKNPMYSLDMSCIKLLAFDILHRLASVFNEEIAHDYLIAQKDLKEQINDIFWSEQDGMYINKYVVGRRLSSNIGATSFYVLFCGVVDTGHKLSLVINNLLNPKKFWLKYPIPTLSADNRQFGKKSEPDNNGFRKPAFLEYRGSIVPYVNYIVYQGLIRYGMDEIATKFALACVKLWQDNKTHNIENYSLYLPTGKRVQDKQYLSSNGNLLALIGVQELLDIEYFSQDFYKFYIRFGTFAKGEHSLSYIKLLDTVYNIKVNDTNTTLSINKVETPIFQADNINEGSCKFVVRYFCITDTGCEFMIDSHDYITIKLNIPLKSKSKATTHVVAISPGKTKIVLKDDIISQEPIVPQKVKHDLIQV